MYVFLCMYIIYNFNCIYIYIYIYIYICGADSKINKGLYVMLFKIVTLATYI